MGGIFAYLGLLRRVWRNRSHFLSKKCLDYVYRNFFFWGGGVPREKTISSKNSAIRNVSKVSFFFLISLGCFPFQIIFSLQFCEIFCLHSRGLTEGRAWTTPQEVRQEDSGSEFSRCIMSLSSTWRGISYHLLY